MAKKAAEGPSASKPGAASMVLPCSQSDFGRFISALLGKPQTIEKAFYGTFEVDQHDIEDVFCLVDQRVKQQNEATLIQFTVKILYDDNSSVLFNSLSDFLNYREVQPLVSLAGYLSWTYLIKFQDKSYPEKQTIELSFATSVGAPLLVHIEEGVQIIPNAVRRMGSVISLRISHTARTWGVDIEALLSGHIAGLLREESRPKTFVCSHSEGIGLATGGVVLLSTLFGAYLAAERVTFSQRAAAKAIAASSSATDLAGKVDFLVDLAAKGIWPRFTLALGVLLFVALVGAVALGIWVESLADNQPRSFVLLTNRAKEMRTKYLEKRRKRWCWFAFSMISGLATSVVANVLFAWLFEGWIR